MLMIVSYGFLAPPTLFITLCLVGGLIALVWYRLGIALVLTAGLCLFALATPALSSYLLQQVEASVPTPPDYAAAQAIVVLGGDQRIGNGADIPDSLGPLSVERVVLAAESFRRLRLPVAVTGGRTPGTHAASADLLKVALEHDFGIPVIWAEVRSRTTYENALYIAPLLKAANIGTVVLITQAWHLSRAIWCFERVGLRALPWPAPRSVPQIREPTDFLPNMGALHDSFYAVHELIGRVYYRLRY